MRDDGLAEYETTYPSEEEGVRVRTFRVGARIWQVWPPPFRIVTCTGQPGGVFDYALTMSANWRLRT